MPEDKDRRLPPPKPTKEMPQAEVPRLEADQLEDEMFSGGAPTLRDEQTPPASSAGSIWEERTEGGSAPPREDAITGFTKTLDQLTAEALMLQEEMNEINDAQLQEASHLRERLAHLRKKYEDKKEKITKLKQLIADAKEIK